jgi:PAS domain S-box-containing protein
MMSNSLNILLVEDNLTDAIIVKDLLRAQSHIWLEANPVIHWVDNYEDGIGALAKGGYQAVLVDNGIPPYTGLEFLEAANQMATDVPLILLTGNSNPEVDREAMRLGASDFLEKEGLTAQLLERSIRYSIDRSEADREKRNRELENQHVLRVARCIIATSIVSMVDGQLVFDSTIRNPETANKLVPLNIEEGESYLQALRNSRFPEDSKSLFSLIEVSLATDKKHFNAEYRLKGSGGSTIWLSEDSTIETISDRKWRITAVCTNITDRKKSEQSIRESNERMTAIIESSLDAIITIDTHGTIVNFNQAAQKMFGYTREEALGQNLAELIMPESLRVAHHAGVAHYLDTSIGPVLSTPTEMPALRKDGSQLNVELFISQVTIDDEIYFVGYLHDITGRIQAERQARFQAHLLDSMGEAVIAADASGRITYFNKAAEDLYKWSSDEVIGLYVLDVILPRQTLSLTKPLQEEVSLSARWKGEVKVQRKGGEIFRAQFTTEPILDEFGQSTGIIAISTDITDRIRTQRELRLNASAQKRLLKRLEAEKQRLADAQTIAKIGSYEHDHRTGKLTWSDETYRIFGVEKDEFKLSYEAILASLPVDERSERDLAYQTSLGSEALFEQDHQILLPDGTTKHVHERCTTSFDRTGKPIRTVGTCQDVTEQRLAQMALEQLRNEYKVILESVGDGIHGTDENGIVTFENDSSARILGWNRFELLGKHGHSVIHHSKPDGSSFPQSECSIYATLMDGRVRRVDDEVFWRKDGSSVAVEYTVAPIYRSSPTPSGVVVVFRDISARRREEELLKGSQRDLANAQRLAQIGSWTYDLPEGSFSFSDEAFRIIGLEPGTIDPSWSNLIQYIHPDDRDLTGVTEVEERIPNETYERELRILRPTGDVAYVRTKTRRLVDEHGATIRLEGTLEDITERRSAEMERDRFFTLSIDMLCIATRDGYFKRLNPAFERVLGFTTQELMDEAFLSFVHPDDKQATIDIFTSILEGNTVTQFVNRYRCKEGGYRWLQWMSIPFEDLIYAAAHDITPVLLAEAELKQANTELELRVARRTEDLEVSNRELDLARQAADRANRAKSEFLSRMSHELRTPLNSILGFGQLLRQEDLEAKTIESVDYILKGGRHLLSLINEILDFASIDAGRTTISIEPVSVPDLLQETVRLVEPLAIERGITLDLDSLSSSTSYYALADQQRLRQVIINLLSNGIKYNRRSGTLRVSCSALDERQISISIQDTGFGIRESDLPKLFVPFERLEAAGSDIEGTGLGLALSDGLLKLMDGRLEVQSEFGIGSTFTVILPRSMAPEQNSLKSQEITNLPDSLEPPGQLKTILCIEDNTSNLTLLDAIFASRANVRLLKAIQGSVGVDLANQHAPDLVLLDSHLPDLTGEEVLERLKRSDRTAQIPVIVVSADATRRRIESILQRGAIAYITKPLNIAEFLTEVDKVLQEKG